jgi:CRP-like cAMP-binding protein
MICDVIYALDIYVILHTSYLSYGVLIYRPDRIRRHYGNFWLAIHIIAAIPLSWVSLFTGGRWLYFILAFPRLLRVHRSIVASDTFGRWLIYDSWASVLVPLAIVWLLVIHFFACLFYLITMLEPEDSAWIHTSGWDEVISQHWHYYIMSVYFAMTTILCCGCGDVVPYAPVEVILVIFIQIVGCSINAWLLGVLVGRLMDTLDQRFLYRYFSFSSFLEFKNVGGVERDISHYFYYKWMVSRGADDPNQVSRLVPETIRVHLKRDMCIDLLMKIHTFRLAGDDEQLITSLIRVLKYVEFAPDEDIFRQGDISSDVLLLSAGKIDVYAGNLKIASMVSCERGQCYGEHELFHDEPRTYTVRAVTHVSGWKLTREDFQIAVGSNPEIRNVMLTIVRDTFPDYYRDVRRMLSPAVIQELTMLVSDESEIGSSDVALAMRESTDSEQD